MKKKNVPIFLENYRIQDHAEFKLLFKQIIDYL
jgi:hypothetical protein